MARTAQKGKPTPKTPNRRENVGGGLQQFMKVIKSPSRPRIKNVCSNNDETGCRPPSLGPLSPLQSYGLKTCKNPNMNPSDSKTIDANLSYQVPRTGVGAKTGSDLMSGRIGWQSSQMFVDVRQDKLVQRPRRIPRVIIDEDFCIEEGFSQSNAGQALMEETTPERYKTPPRVETQSSEPMDPTIPEVLMPLPSTSSIPRSQITPEQTALNINEIKTNGDINFSMSDEDVFSDDDEWARTMQPNMTIPEVTSDPPMKPPDDDIDEFSDDEDWMRAPKEVLLSQQPPVRPSHLPLPSLHGGNEEEDEYDKMLCDDEFDSTVGAMGMSTHDLNSSQTLNPNSSQTVDWNDVIKYINQSA